jgi:hypothetical protein
MEKVDDIVAKRRAVPAVSKGDAAPKKIRVPSAAVCDG